MATTPSMTFRTILEQVNDVGESAAKDVDELLALSGIENWTAGQRLVLAAAAADQAVTFTDAVALFIFSHDEPFKLRLASGGTLLANLRCFLLVGDTTTTAVHSTSVLLTGNGVSPASLEIWKVEKVST